jgi:hypothetical protein
MENYALWDQCPEAINGNEKQYALKCPNLWIY